MFPVAGPEIAPILASSAAALATTAATFSGDHNFLGGRTLLANMKERFGRSDSRCDCCSGC
jgi:hypothetical protein